jgi:hypothetical protein
MQLEPFTRLLVPLFGDAVLSPSLLAPLVVLRCLPPVAPMLLETLSSGSVLEMLPDVTLPVVVLLFGFADM